MLLGGDEQSRTQGGNNNAWCQDNETSWLDWGLDERRQALLDFTRRLIALRTSQPVFRRTRFLADGENGSGLPEAWWFRPDGRKLSQVDWQGEGRALGVFLNGDGLGDSFVLLVNAGSEPVAFKLPPARFGRRWLLELATADPVARADVVGSPFEVEGLGLTLLRREA